MTASHHRSYILIIFFLVCHILNAQVQDLPINEWKVKLSVKKDRFLKNYLEVYNAVLAYDNVNRCRALEELQEQAKEGNARFRIRTAMMTAYLPLGESVCAGKGPTVQLLEDALRSAYELDDPLLTAEINNALSAVHENMHELGLAIMYKTIAVQIREQTGFENFRNNAYYFLDLGKMLYHSRDYRYSANMTLRAIRYEGQSPETADDSLDNYWLMNAWNNLGLAYKRLGLYDSAFVSLNHALTLSIQKNSDPFWPALIQGNRGDVFFLQGRYDSAEALLRLDYEKTLGVEPANSALSLTRLASIINSRGDHVRALQMLREAQGLEHRDANDYYRNEIQHTLAEVFRDLGQADSSFWYMDQYVRLHDKLEEIAASNRAEIVHLELVNQEGVHKLLTLNKDKHRIAIIRNFTIILIIVLTALGFLYINRLKLKSSIRQQQALEQQRLAEAEAKNAIDQLNSFTENLVEKTKLVENLQSRLLEKELNEEQIQQIQELSHYSILTDADWEQFKSLFTTVYPGFFIELKRKVNDITLAEQRMAALIKLQVSNKDAATMLGISINSVHKTRQRLRQRLGFEQDGELENYFTVVSTALNDRDSS